MVATVVCLAPRVLPLTPQVVFGLSAIGRLPFLRRLPLFGSCCRNVVAAVVSAVSVRPAQSVSASISFRASGCGAGSLLTAVSIVRNRRDRAPTLARSNNYRCSPPTAFARPSETRTGGASLGLRLVSRARATLLVASQVTPARRRIPRFAMRRSATFSGGRGDICLGDEPPSADGSLQGAGNASSSRPFRQILFRASGSIPGPLSGSAEANPSVDPVLSKNWI